MLILEVGEPKSGKTISACTFPKPAILLDFDDGFTSVENARGKDGKLLVPDWEEINVVKFFSKGYYDLDFKTPDLRGATSAPKHTAEAMGVIKKTNEILRSLNEDGCYDRGVGFNGEGPYETLIIDSLTTMFRWWKHMIMKMNNVPQLRIQDYGTLENLLFGQFIPSIKAIHQKIPNVILIDHLQMDKDEMTGRIMEFPIGPSQNMGRALTKEFDEIYLQTLDKDIPSWATKKSGFFRAGSRLDLPSPIKPANYQQLVSVLESRKKKEVIKK